MNTGEVVAGREAASRGELMVSGDAVNVAARLQQRAEPGQVLVGERTILATTDREWAQLTTTPLPRALAAAGETELLERVAMAFRLRAADIDAPRISISATVAEGLVALAAGDADIAAAQLRDAADRERGFGWAYRAACIDLDVARALDAADRPTEAAAARNRANAILEPLGCVNAY